MDAAQLTRQYLAEKRTMQIATLHDGKPWICTVYYVHDAGLNLYWMSLPTRQHSQDITSDPHVAVAVAVKFDQPIIGLQAAGTAQAVDDSGTIQQIMKDYVAKYEQGQEFYDNFVAGKSKHVLYKFTPEKYILFDEVNFHDGVGHSVPVPAIS